MARVRALRVGQVRSLVGSCVPGDSIPARRLVVERVGANGRTFTFLGLSGSVVGCDRSPRAHPKPWCGRASWPLRSGRVSDARLSICQDRRGRPVVAFAWINPLPRAAWIVVDQPGYGEVFAAVGHLPVRVTSVSGIGHGRARFRYTQYDRRGVRLTRRTIVPAVAG
jgi:hypothetical protein